MLNITSRLAVRPQNLPDWDFDWSDMEPQRPVEELGISDFLPDEEDMDMLKERAIQYVMRFLVTELQALAHLQKSAPVETVLHPVKKSVVVPMKVLFKDEKYTDETIDILSQIMADANLSGNSQVILNLLQICT